MAIKAPSGEPGPPEVTLLPVEEGSAFAEALALVAPELNGVAQILVVAVDGLADPEQVKAAAQEVVGLAQHADLEHLVSILAPELGLPSAAVLEQSRRNARLREELIREFGALTAREVADLAGSEALNRSQFAHSLARAGRIFSVIHKRQQLYPAFQFDSDGPIPAIAEVLPVLRARFRKDWQIALWFTTENYWVDNQRPVDLLDEPAVLTEAARAGADRSGF